MKARLTVRYLDGLKVPSDGPRHVEIHDESGQVPGATFGVRVSRETGRKTFFVRVVLPDRRRSRLTLGSFPTLGLAEARDKARRIVASVSDGGDPAGERREYRQAPTVEDLADLYLDSPRFAGLSAATRRQYKQAIKSEVVPAVGGIKAADIGKAQIAAILDAILKRGSKIQANRVRAAASVLFSFAAEREIVARNPVADLKPPSKERRRERVLSEAEIRRLWEVSSEDGLVVGSLVKVLILTAQRTQETARMRWEQIEGDTWSIPAADTKSGRAHSIPLAAEVFEVLEPLRKLSQEWVFLSPSRRGSGPVRWMGKATVRLRSECGFDFRLHDLRRTAATGMANQGAAAETLSRILNHAPRGVLAHYDLADREQSVRRALFRWASHVQAVLSGQQSKVIKIG